MKAYRNTGALLYLTHFLGLLADALIRVGNASEAQAISSEALDLVEETGERFYEAELYRLKGESLIVSGAFNATEQQEAKSCFQQAIKVARRQGAHALEWRAMLSLAQLCLEQGNQEGAEKLLRKICKATVDVEDTVDIKRAKVLLDQLI